MITVFFGLSACLLAILMVVNARFLEPYYISNTETEFIKTYERLNNAVREEGLEDRRNEEVIRQITEKNNMSFLVVNNDFTVTNVHDFELLNNQLVGYLLNRTQKTGEVLDKTEDYELTLCEDQLTSMNYIEMWGVLDDGSHFLIRSPMESIKQSTTISNEFLLYIGCFVIVICIVLVSFFTNKLTDPLLELTALSDKMANLDFEAKYTGGGPAEIGELGENFNRMSEKLESTISELKSANNELLKDIEQKDKLEQMRNEFLGNASHELKTPLALIQGYAEGLREGIAEDPESIQFYCDVIMDEAEKMNVMVKNLLALNQLEFGDEEIEFKRFDIVEMISGVLQSMDIMIRKKDGKVIFKKETSVYVWADEFKTEQVVRNYISNAVNHLDGEMVIEVKVQVEENIAKIAVFNTGTPIPEEAVPHLWDKFYKVDKSHTRQYGGNGIGLCIVKAIMESFHQKYGVNNYDNGVEFWFTLDVK